MDTHGSVWDALRKQGPIRAAHREDPAYGSRHFGRDDLVEGREGWLVESANRGCLQESAGGIGKSIYEGANDVILRLRDRLQVLNGAPAARFVEPYKFFIAAVCLWVDPFQACALRSVHSLGEDKTPRRSSWPLRA